jgi:CRISPR-associated protein Csb2
MPTREKPTKVIDAFAYVGEGTLGILFDGDFDEAERALAAALIERLPYLGRAESWVEGRVLSSFDLSTFDCVPLAEGESMSNVESLRLLALEETERYGRWRTASVEAALAAALREKRKVAEEKGKKPPAKLSKADEEKVQALYPASALEGLLWETSRVQGKRDGWSAPPGSRWVSYRLPSIRKPRVNVTLPSLHFTSERIDTALLALSADAERVDLYPPMRDAIRRMELLHQTLVSRSDPESRGEASPVFTGKIDGQRLRGHRHAFLIPLQLGRRQDRIDHVFVHAPGGFDAKARLALRTIRKTYAKGLPELFVTLSGIGTLSDFEEIVPDAQAARTWRSRTPFVPPRHLKRRGKNALRGQLEAELSERGVAGLVDVRIELDDGRFVSLDAFEEGMVLTHRFRHFRRERTHNASPTRHAFSLELHFDGAVRGPIALGYACHFGLGVFEPDFTSPPPA